MNLDQTLDKTLRVAFFGASTTVQKHGMSFYFQQIHPELNVKSFGNGGSHIFTAGICLLEDVIKFSPSYCFLDWFLTLNPAIKDTDLECYLNTIIHKLNSINCVPIFLFLPADENTLTQQRLELYEKIGKFAEKINCYSIFINKEIDKNKILLRDNCHPTEEGSKEYAKIIDKHFLSFLTLKKNILSVPETLFTYIKKMSLNDIVYEKLSFKGSGKVLITYLAGPHSGMIEAVTETGAKVHNLFDAHCYYERLVFYHVFFTFKEYCIFNILSNDVDYTNIAKKQRDDWHQFKKCLKIVDVFYIGEIYLDQIV